MAYGPYGARGAASAYNPRTGTSAATRQGSNVYGSWGATGVQRGDQWAATARTTNNVTGVTKRATQTSGGGEAISRTGPGGSTTVARTGSGDVYAGHDGNVYRKQGDSCQKYEPGQRLERHHPPALGGDPRLGRAHRGCHADARPEQRAQRHLVEVGQLSRERRRGPDGLAEAGQRAAAGRRR